MKGNENYKPQCDNYKTKLHNHKIPVSITYTDTRSQVKELMKNYRIYLFIYMHLELFHNYPSNVLYTFTRDMLF